MSKISSSSDLALLISKEEAIAVIKKYGRREEIKSGIVPELLQSHVEFWNLSEEESDEVFKERIKPEARLENICKAMDEIAAHLLSKGARDEKIRLFVERDGADGLLRAKLKEFANEDDIILFMKEHLEYVTLLNSLSEEKSNERLEHFPPSSVVEYECLEGIRDRQQESLKALKRTVMMPKERAIFDAHSEVVERFRIDFSPLIYRGNQPHLLPAIEYLCGVEDKTKRFAKSTVISIPAQKAWQASISYITKVNELLADRQEVFELIRKKDPNKEGDYTESQRLLEPLGIDIKDVLQEEGGSYRYQWSDSKIRKVSANIKIKDPLTLPLPPSLFDEDAPEKIAALIDSDILSNREVGINALLLIGRPDQVGGSPIQYLNILHALGMRKDGVNREDALSEGIRKLNHVENSDELSTAGLGIKAGIAAGWIKNYSEAPLPINDMRPYIEYLGTAQSSSDLPFSLAVGNAPLHIFQPAITSQNLPAEQFDSNFMPNIHWRFRHNPQFKQMFELLLHKNLPENILIQWGSVITFESAVNRDTDTIEYILNRPVLGENMFKIGLIISKSDQYGMTAVHLAVVAGDNNMLKFLLSQKDELENRMANPDIRNSQNITPLMMATAQGNLTLAKTIVSFGVNLNLRDSTEFGGTVLHWAAAGGHANIMEFILNQKDISGNFLVDLNLKNKNGVTPVMAAVLQGEFQCVKILKEAGAYLSPHDANVTLHLATKRGHAGVIEFLHKENLVANFDVQNNEGYAPMMVAVGNEDIDCVIALTKAGANLNLRDSDEYGDTALHAAAVDGCVEIVEFILEQKNESGEFLVNPDITNNKGVTPLMRAVQGGNLECIVVLVAYGANPSRQDNDFGETAIHWAVRTNHADTVELLLKHKDESGNLSNPDIANKSGITPLMYAAMRGYSSCVKTLTRAGCYDFQGVVAEGQMALEIEKYQEFAVIAENITLLAGEKCRATQEINDAHKKQLDPIKRAVFAQLATIYDSDVASFKEEISLNNSELKSNAAINKIATQIAPYISLTGANNFEINRDNLTKIKALFPDKEAMTDQPPSQIITAASAATLPSTAIVNDNSR